MKKILFNLAICLLLFTACSIKQQPKLCNATIEEPSNAKLNKLLKKSQMEKPWQKEKSNISKHQ